MTVFIVFKDGMFFSVHRAYEYAEEHIQNQYFDSDFPHKYEIVPYHI